MALLNKVSLITGGARGLGKAFAERLLEHGGRVILVDLLEKEGRLTAEQFNQTYPDKVLFYPGDVTDVKSITQTWEEGQRVFEDKIDILVNNAGVGPQAGLQKCFDINLMALMKLSYLAEEKMSLQNNGRGGTIVNIASAAGLIKSFVSEMIPYGVAKSGVISFTRSMASTGSKKRHGVIFGALCPSFTETDIIKGMEKQIEEEFNMPVIPVSTVADSFEKLLTDLLTQQVKSGAIMLCVPGQEQSYANKSKM